MKTTILILMAAVALSACGRTPSTCLTAHPGADICCDETGTYSHDAIVDGMQCSSDAKPATFLDHFDGGNAFGGK